MFDAQRVLAVIVAASVCLCRAAASDAGPLGYEYLAPLPGSARILPETNIIIRPGGLVDAASLAGGDQFLRVSGSLSGPHAGLLRLSDDRRSLTFQPDQPFTSGEVVTCRLDAALVTDTRGLLPGADFSFTVAGPERDRLRDLQIPIDHDEGPPPTAGSSGVAPARTLRSAALSESLPPDFPQIQAKVYGTTTPGRLFLCDFVFDGTPVPSYLMILNNDGTPFFQRKLPGVGLDFKMQPDGRLTYFDFTARCFYALNANYAVVDSFRCGNGYQTDGHDLLLLPNGHAVLMSYDPEIVDLSQVAKNGLPNATVIGLIVQELDQDKNVVFQWRSWDHFQITDCVDHSLSDPVVDYVHGNSIDVDPDGNLILSCRHMNEVTKISRATGEILWRLGGKNNQFSIDDPIQFSHQHAVKRLPNGHIVMFDNGNFRLPLFSRAVEYAIDDSLKTATLVWQYRLDPDVFGPAFGYVQRFSNGNTLICWGATAPTLTEVAPDGSIVSKVTFTPPIASYRAFRFEWPPVKPATVVLDPSELDGTRGGSITALITPEAGDFSLSDVEISTVRLDQTVAADTTDGADLGDANGNSLMVRFEKEAVLGKLAPGPNRVEVSGSLATGELFQGFAEVRLDDPSAQRAAPVSLRLVSTLGTVPVELAAGGAGSRARSYAIYDIQGRRLKTLRLDASDTRLTWDGRASNGRPVASGVYLLREEGQPSGSSLKVVIRR